MGRPRGWSRLSVRNWRVRAKLAAVVLVPSVAFVAVGGLELHSTVRTSQLLDTYTGQVGLSREVTALIHQLQRERDRTAGALVATDRTRPLSTAIGEFSALTAADWRATNAAVQAYHNAADPVVARADATFAGRTKTAASALDELPELRAAAAEGQLAGDAVFDGYSRIVFALLRVLPGATAVSAGPGMHGLTDLTQAKELQSQVRGRIQAVAQAGRFAFGERQTIADLRARRAAALDRFRADADTDQLAAYETAARGKTVVVATQLERRASDGTKVDAGEWWTASSAQVDAYRSAELTIIADAVRSTRRAADAAADRTWLVGALVATLLLASLVTSFAVGRSMASSLRRLRRRALVVAQHDLPEALRTLSTATGATPEIRVEPAPAESADEIGEVATAFDAVHRSAVRLATEQAALRRDVSAMFVNLARRSQVLVGRQLSLLDELEAEEHDPDRLAKFFALDHLATRMRRNDENLLVLAASESNRLWREPVPLATVLLGAVAETEQYERVQAHGPDDVAVAGHLVPDLLHLLAELLDNATAFSPPSAAVQLSGRTGRGGAGLEAVITVEDSGMGMTQSMLADANRRLAEPAGIDVSVSERMGLFVVSRLAARHGMRVELRGAPGGGVTAAVWLPESLLCPTPQPEPEEPPAEHAQAVEPPAEEPAGNPDIEDTQQLATAPSLGEEPTTDLTPIVVPADDAPPERTPPADESLPRRAPADGSLPRRTPAATATAKSDPTEPDVTGGWWSGDGSGWRGTPPPARPAESRTSAAGLPVRVPTTSGSGTPSLSLTSPTQGNGDTPLPAEPGEVSDTLARFHSGIRRADDEDPATCSN